MRYSTLLFSSYGSTPVDAMNKMMLKTREFGSKGHLTDEFHVVHSQMQCGRGWLFFRPKWSYVLVFQKEEP